MTKYYNAIFTYYGQPVTISAKVTDRDEPRPRWQPVEALRKMRALLLSCGIHCAQIQPRTVHEVSKAETMSKAATLAAMEEARAQGQANIARERERADKRAAFWAKRADDDMIKFIYMCEPNKSAEDIATLYSFAAGNTRHELHEIAQAVSLEEFTQLYREAEKQIIELKVI